jgi:peroxiredoxin
LQADLAKIEAAGIQLVGVSYDSVEVLAGFAEKAKITFPLLSDPGSKTIIAYGLPNKDAKGRTAGIPYPGTMVIDRDGVIRAKLFHDGYKERHTPQDLIKAAKGSAGPPDGR